MKAKLFYTTDIEGYDRALSENCWCKGDGPADDIRIGTIMLIVLRPPRHTSKPQDYINRPPVLRKIISINSVPDEKVPDYLKKKFKEKGKTIMLGLEPITPNPSTSP